jgi:hypothetical protein
MSCTSPRATKRIVTPPRGALAWCPSCKSFQPAAQVLPGKELRNASGDITATYAPKAH